MNILEEIETRPRPADIAAWWKRQPPVAMTGPLEDEELGYLEYFTSTEVDLSFRIGRGIANKTNLTSEDRTRLNKHFGSGPNAVDQFINYENRRRIVAHYTLTHPATIQYELQLYRLSRDVNPAFFVAERVYELFSGEEAFTGQRISRMAAGAELLVPLIVGRVLRYARSGLAAPPRPYTRALTDPIYDLPSEGGLSINGRWYTEHALERMAPDTPAVRAHLRSKYMERLKKLGLSPDSAAWDACLGRALRKVDPRGVPPSVVEAEIARPGSTNVKVITARRKSVVVTVIPR